MEARARLAFALAAAWHFRLAHFPDLLNYEDTDEKIRKARNATQMLKREMDKVNIYFEGKSKSEERIKNAEEKLKKIQSTQEQFEKLKSDLEELCQRIGEPKAGYEFETWFYGLACFFDVEARKPYKDKNGRQIDGSITLEGTTYLVETKFTKDKTGSEEIDTFYSKVIRKAENTMGIILSISGYNDNAIANASRDRTPLLLFDYSHIFNLILNQTMTLPDVVTRVKRHASQSGESFLSVNKFSG